MADSFYKIHSNIFYLFQKEVQLNSPFDYTKSDILIVDTMSGRLFVFPFPNQRPKQLHKRHLLLNKYSKITLLEIVETNYFLDANQDRYSLHYKSPKHFLPTLSF